jgi:uncharacterized membrane protein YvlD (DUF360 family)
VQLSEKVPERGLFKISFQRLSLPCNLYRCISGYFSNVIHCIRLNLAAALMVSKKGIKRITNIWVIPAYTNDVLNRNGI